MKPPALLLAVSLAVNVALATFVIVGHETSNTSPLFSFFHRQSREPSQTSGSTGPSEPGDTSKTQPLAPRDPAALYQQFRAMGLTDETARRMLRALLLEPYYARYRALVAKHQSDKPEFLRSPLFSSGFSKEERAELRTLARDINRQIASALGSTSVEPDLENLRYSFLPQDKADQLRQINRDYAEMRTDLNDEIGRFRVASDDQKLKLLEQERRKDIESLLTPEELTAYDLHYSATASALRNRLANVNVSDSEFRDLFNILKPVYDAASPANLNPRSNQPLTADQLAQLSAQRDTKTKAEEQIRALLGDERYADYTKAGNSDYRTLQAAATRFNLSPQTVDQVFSLRNTVSTESLQIANDPSLAPEQKKTALSEVVSQARAQIRASLGQEIGDAYLQTSMQWLDRVSSGYTITFSPQGNFHSFKPVAPRIQPPQTTPK